MEEDYGAWENDEIPNPDLSATWRRQPKLPALRHGESQQFGLLPLDGAKVRVWDSKVFPRPIIIMKKIGCNFNEYSRFKVLRVQKVLFFLLFFLF